MTTTMGWEWDTFSWSRRGLEDDERHLRRFVRDVPLHWFILIHLMSNNDGLPQAILQSSGTSGRITWFGGWHCELSSSFDTYKLTGILLLFILYFF
ncbi:hypothetical protein EJB05_51486 [Eragrostis curvula]|uniref:Uncharacterized protein n=1 Tax=Eragrostis curvula TaxID=38414 RepID=A0A5J9SVE0_9POAL|nr:hypothetical protein EJB05_51486 [Eragrostis curvula]